MQIVFYALGIVAFLTMTVYYGFGIPAAFARYKEVKDANRRQTLRRQIDKTTHMARLNAKLVVESHEYDTRAQRSILNRVALVQAFTDYTVAMSIHDLESQLWYYENKAGLITDTELQSRMSVQALQLVSARELLIGEGILDGPTLAENPYVSAIVV